MEKSVQQPITGFHKDDAEDWVAELGCGHFQHVRHKPPWNNRDWVISEAGRSAKLGSTLSCKKCARGEPKDTP